MTVALDFLIVGAAKCGTTSIDRVLRGHPTIQLPKGTKETYYWIYPKSVLGNGVGYTESSVISKPGVYENLFSWTDTAAQKNRGEVCNGYLYFYRETIPNIRSKLGDVRILIVLRNPVARAYSGYLHLLREKIVNETFHHAIDKEEQRVAQGYWWAFHLYRIGMYYEAVLAYKSNFSNVGVFFFEDLVKDREKFYRNLFAFLGIETHRELDTSVHANRTGVPRNPLIWNALRRDTLMKRLAKQVMPEVIQRAIKTKMEGNIVKPAMDDELGQELWSRYLPDVERLSKLLDRDLVALWRQK